MDDNTDHTDAPPRRTNSLAFATTDCHRCSAHGTTCDRLRPQCSPCLRLGQKCPGFVIPLSWDTRRMFVSQPAAEASATTDQDTHVKEQRTSEPQHKTRQGGAKKFRFVEKPHNKRRKISNRRELAAVEIEELPADHEMPRPDPAPSAIVPDLPSLPASTHETRDEVDTSVIAEPHQWGAVPEGDNIPIDQKLSGKVLGFSGNRLLHDPHPFGGEFPLDESGFDSSSLDMSPGVLEPNFNVDLENMDLGDSNFADNTTINMSMVHGINTSLPTLERSDFVADDTIPASWGSTFIPPRPFEPFAFGAGGAVPNAVIPRSLNLSDDVLLNMYDSEICVLPVTADTRHNPFRCRRDTSRGSKLLYHAISALVYQHLNHKTSICASEAKEHKSRASQELTLALQSPNNTQAESSLHLLDSLLIMFTLECTLSASGPWTQHLKRAKTVLETAGGVSALTQPRLRSQVAMLIWWDTTLALVSRKGQTLKPAYFTHVSKYEKQDGWSFYDLSGCPSALMSILVRLAQLAAQQEVARSMEWLTFDLTPIFAIHRTLQDFPAEDIYPSSISTTFGSVLSNQGSTSSSGRVVDHQDVQNDEDMDEDNINEQSDTYHCVEAWRHALLAYTIRVFLLRKPKVPESQLSQPLGPENDSQNTSPKLPRRLWSDTGHQTCQDQTRQQGHDAHSKQQQDYRRKLHRAVRTTLNHVRSVRRSSQTQKQLLLPVFLAGSETSDEELRGFARGYCEWWANKSRYQMFSTVPDLFTDIWAAVDKAKQRAATDGDIEVPWWGDVIDQKLEGAAETHKNGTHYLFG